MKMIIKWYSIARLTSGKRIKYWYIALNRIKWISMITETCNPVRCNSQTCLHLNTKLSVSACVCSKIWWKHKEKLTNPQTERSFIQSPLSTADQAERQKPGEGRRVTEGERRCSTGDSRRTGKTE